jgi:STE24 endopeptidase
MSFTSFSVVVIFFIIATSLARLWLCSRQKRHIFMHRDFVPEQFAQQIPLESHQKAADYTISKTSFSRFLLLVSTVLFLFFTFFGGLQVLSAGLYSIIGKGMLHQIALIVSFTIISGIIDLPLDYYQQFVLEEKYGFNKMTPRLFFVDAVKSTAIGVILGLPLVWIILSLMGKAGDWWWLYAWLFWCAFQATMLILYPAVIAPLFNKFTPLDDDSLRTRIEALLHRTGFASKGLFVMDGSKRSSHGNAYFSGLGAAKRIVFFDTLIARLAPSEIEAVLAHELGHFKLKHVAKRMVMLFLISLGFLALLGYLKTQPWFYAGLGVDPITGSTDAMALLLFALVLPLFTFFLSPLLALSSRKHEYEADAFAAKITNPQDMVSALVKMYEDNASTLTPDPLYSAFYDSHPPASLRVSKLLDQAEYSA